VIVMKGSQLTLYAANQRHRKLKKTVVDWVLDEIAQAGIHGATVTDVLEGIDANGRYHSSRFFELIDQPVAIMAAAGDAQIDALMANLKTAGVPLFFIRCPIEFAMLGAPDESEGARE
jgi:PII-like signaling protein